MTTARNALCGPSLRPLRGNVRVTLVAAAYRCHRCERPWRDCPCYDEHRALDDAEGAVLDREASL